MNGQHRKTLIAIFSDPVSASLAWRDIEALMVACGAVLSEGSGSRVRVVAVFHRPHPHPVTDKGAVKSVRRFLDNAGIRP